ncbi:bifunctional acyl-ACP--phospholipid O-acyltransferase/long-chain-fatty-acid--ACP ligase [Methylotenera sp.]|uniref:bifunctional acyl-ACP--phospholipid O-acyltransferase/long-chain-fatty-acid--ACP ligase n=1 Tax=Methylotenera sp. TaxID=2051956 RepID=UPI0027353B13|nr:bifunctional acyl-ACP--phospholipid O-acyltransferase/long-chain-fatty-acid--ACP ligase [Methylotenera sp.]MDP3209988.1 bifunctional acyl-ACP--phospholipid O-acyltransferase/long-chain-fatty-acid--ACP ligase [Methylotenera sp.]
MIGTLLQLICRVIFRVDVTGIANLPKQGKLLIIANHESFLDGLLLGLFLPIRATFVVHTTVLNHWFFRQILRLTPYLAVDPTSPLAMKKVIKLLEAGKPVVIFPEGRITLTGSLMKVYDGPGFVAAKTDAMILPVRIDGAARSYFSRLRGSHPRRLFPKVTISILPIRHINMPQAPTAKARRRLAGDAMRREMQNMLFSSAPISTLFSALLDAVATHGRGTMLVEDMRQVEESYGDLLKKSLALGRLASKVSNKHENIGVLMPNVTNTICLIFGLSAFTRVPAMLNYTAGSAGIQNACTAAAVKSIISSREFIKTAKLEEVIAGLKDIKIVYLEDLSKQFNWLDKLWLMGFALWLPKLAVDKCKSNDPAVVLFTSGSEGKPKGVVHTHTSILANIAQIKSVIDFSMQDKFMMVLPLFHAFGFTCGAIMPLVAGSKLFVYPSPLHYRVIPEVIYDRGCTVLFGTSTFLANYAKFANPYDFYKLRYVVAGAEKLKEEVRKTWVDKFGIRILEGYGATECAPVLAVNTPMANKLGSVGALMPSLESKLESVPGIEQGGLLSVRGPNVMRGYYLFDNPGVIQAPQDQWYNTGDIVEIDEDGFVFIKGRVKRFAKVAGEMVSLETVESIANNASPQHQHAATTSPDAQRGENIILYTTDSSLNREQLSNSAKTLGSPELAIARKIILIEALPLLGTGKTDYVTLRKMAEDSDATFSK